jgi:hypothetical protein
VSRRAALRVALRRRRPERAELMLGGLAVSLLLLIAGMLAFVFAQAWPQRARLVRAGRQRQRPAR